MIEVLIEFTARVIVEFAFYTVCYGLGWSLLRLVTFGRYPPRSSVPHNREFVALVPIVTLFIALTLVYS